MWMNAVTNLWKRCHWSNAFNNKMFFFLFIFANSCFAFNKNALYCKTAKLWRWRMPHRTANVRRGSVHKVNWIECARAMSWMCVGNFSMGACYTSLWFESAKCLRAHTHYVRCYIFRVFLLLFSVRKYAVKLIFWRRRTSPFYWKFM